jgi:hypothetical protein
MQITCSHRPYIARDPSRYKYVTQRETLHKPDTL